jgi:hypothetical protein
MGARTDAAIASWQEEYGIEPANGKWAVLIDELSTLAFELIKVAGDGELSDTAYDLIKILELERSGIRDGDGCWHGCDAAEATIHQAEDACEGSKLKEAKKLAQQCKACRMFRRALYLNEPAA